MKRIERDQAQLLRRQGLSINEIVQKLKVSKSSVSLWVRNVHLSQRHKKRLSMKGRTLEAIENRRIARFSNERARRRVIFDEAARHLQTPSKRDLTFLGLGLYWGEGSKTSRGSVSFCNADPQTIQVIMKFFTEICNVPKERFRGHVHLHSHLDQDRAEKHWSTISGIPRTQFQKTTIQHNKTSKGKKDSLPLGTFTASVYDTSLYLKIMGQTYGAYKKLIKQQAQIPARFETYL